MGGNRNDAEPEPEPLAVAAGWAEKTGVVVVEVVAVPFTLVAADAAAC
jgi:hypothetical protein